jgi:uncharacterized membrane protein YdbT with pleckstrin-like domain
MSYVKHILLPNEQVLYDGHVHPTVLLPGAIRLGIAALLLMASTNTGGGHSWLLSFAYNLGQVAYWTRGFYNTLAHWQVINPNIAIEIKVLALIIALAGFARFMNGVISMQTTELIVTDKRIICKTGVLTITTVEMDRTRVAGVIVDQSFLGRIMGYGHIYIQGFTSNIGGLPPMANPHMVERFVQ